MGHSTSRRSILVAGISGLAFAAAGCAARGSAPSTVSTGPANVDAAKSEGQVVIYTGAGESSVIGWSKQFTDKYGIKVEVVRKATYDLWDQWQTELTAGKHLADVLLVSDSTLFDAAIPKGQLAKFKPTSDPDYPAVYTKSGYYYPLQQIALSIVYNTKVNSAAAIQFIRSNGYNALADPRFKGLEAVVTPASGGSDYIWWYLLMHVQASTYGDAFVKKMAALSPKVYTSSLPVYSMVESGQYHVAGAASETTIGLDWANGAPIEWVFPDPTPVFTLPQAIAATAPHPEAAKLFQEWSTSVAGEEAWYNGNWGLGTPMNSQARDLRKFTTASWYSPPKNPYTSWVTDPNYAKLESSLIQQWTTDMGS